MIPSGLSLLYYGIISLTSETRGASTFDGNKETFFFSTFASVIGVLFALACVFGIHTFLIPIFNIHSVISRSSGEYCKYIPETARDSTMLADQITLDHPGYRFGYIDGNLSERRIHRQNYRAQLVAQNTLSSRADTESTVSNCAAGPVAHWGLANLACLFALCFGPLGI